MKKPRTLIPFVLLLAGTLCLFGGEIIEEIVAIVNEDVITFSQYREAYQSALQMLKSQLQGEELDQQTAQLKDGLLENMITNILLIQAAREKKLTVGEQVKMAIERIKKENNLGSDDELVRALQQTGIDFEQWKKQLEEQFMRDALLYSEVDRSIALDDAETVNYYKNHPAEFTDPAEYKLSAIYLAAEGKTEETLEAKKKEVSAKLAEGVNLGELAAEYSEGPGKDAKGDIGTFKAGEIDKALGGAASKLKVGEASGWIMTKNGWYLIKLEEKKESRLKTFEEVKKSVEESLYGEQRQKKIVEFLKQLREKSYVKILKPNPLNL